VGERPVAAYIYSTNGTRSTVAYCPTLQWGLHAQLLSHVACTAAQPCRMHSCSAMPHAQLLSHVACTAAQPCRMHSCSAMPHAQLLSHVACTAAQPCCMHCCSAMPHAQLLQAGAQPRAAGPTPYRANTLAVHEVVWLLLSGKGRCPSAGHACFCAPCLDLHSNFVLTLTLPFPNYACSAAAAGVTTSMVFHFFFFSHARRGLQHPPSCVRLGCMQSVNE